MPLALELEEPASAEQFPGTQSSGTKLMASRSVILISENLRPRNLIPQNLISCELLRFLSCARLRGSLLQTRMMSLSCGSQLGLASRPRGCVSSQDSCRWCRADTPVRRPWLSRLLNRNQSAQNSSYPQGRWTGVSTLHGSKRMVIFYPFCGPRV